MILRIDYDKFVWRVVDTLYMLKDIPTPFDVRISPGNEGLHIRKEGDYTYDNPLYQRYDDPKRLHINRLRQQNRLSSNVLWDVKKGRSAGTWHRINNNADILSFMTLLKDLDMYRKQRKYVAMPKLKYPLTNRGIGK